MYVEDQGGNSAALVTYCKGVREQLTKERCAQVPARDPLTQNTSFFSCCATERQVQRHLT